MATDTKSCLDRFIPRRKELNVDLSYYKLTKRSDSAELWRRPQDSDRKHENIARDYFLHQKYKKRLTEAMFPLSETTKILNFSDGNASRNQKWKEDYRVPKTTDWPSLGRKSPQIRSPNVILDMPDLPTEITHHVIDWGKRGDLATVYEKEVYLWNPERSEPTLLTTNEEYVGSYVRWNTTGNYLAIALRNGVISVWHFDKKKTPMEVASHFGCYCLNACTMNTIEWSKANDIITGCNKGCITVLTLPDLKMKKTLSAHTTAIIAIKLSKEEKLLATSSLGCNVKLHEWPSLKTRFTIGTLDAPTKALAWHPWKDALFCVGTANGKIRLWNTATASLVAEHELPNEHIDSLTFNELTGELVVSCWSECALSNGEVREDSRILIYSSFDNLVDAIVWHLGRIPYLVWNQDSTQLATASADENLCVWDFIDSDTKKKYMVKKKKLSVDPLKNMNAFRTFIR